MKSETKELLYDPAYVDIAKITMIQIKYEKDGYETAYSEWLPVPPSQTDVNIGLVSYSQPSVQSIQGYEEYIEVVFDKYMNTETFTPLAVVLKENGQAIETILEFVDAEADPTDENRSYGKILHIKLRTGSLDITADVNLALSKMLSSYADVVMENDVSDRCVAGR